MPIMNDFHRRGGTGGGAEMAVTGPKQTDSSNVGEYWHDVHNELSPVRKHLIHTYLQVQDEEALPLLGEYFGVALSFMALGALVRASNSSKKRRKSMSDEERLDLRACSRFQRMALESMLKEAMERLRGLAQNSYQMEERVRDLVEAEMEKDKEKVLLLSRVSEAEKVVHELKGLRKAEGKANERVMSIVAAKEQDWLKEKRNLQKEVERLKENLNTVCREVKFQSRRCRSPTCEHCKGIERVVRNVRGRVSLRELNSREISAHISSRREVVKVEQPSEVEEVEEERVLVTALEQKKKRSERPGHLQVHDKVEKHEKHWTATRSSVNPSGGSAGGAGQYMTKELIAKQQQEMENELANILKRVGILKQRSHSSSVTTTEQQNTSQERKDVTSAGPIVPLESRSSSVGVEAGNRFSDKAVSGKVEAVEEEEAPSKRSFVFGSDLDLADDLTTGHLSLEQEVFLSVEEDPDLLELEKAFEFEEATDNTSNASGEANREDTKSIAEASNAETTEEAQISIDEDVEIAEFESCLSSDQGVASFVKFCDEAETSKDIKGEELDVVAISSISHSKEVLLNQNAEATEVLKTEIGLAFSFIVETTIALEKADQVLIRREEAAGSELSGTTSMSDVDGESLDRAVIETENSLVDAFRESLEQCEKPDTPRKVDDDKQADSSNDAVSEAAPSVRGELPLDGLDKTNFESPLRSDESFSAGSSCAGSVEEVPSQEVVDGDDRAEPVVSQGHCSELVTEESVSPVDEGKALAEDVKVVDASYSFEPEQVFEVVGVDSVAGLSEEQDTPLEDVENVHSSATETDLTERDQNALGTGEKSDLDAEIPVFGRASKEDLTGDLPEPDEKRVCDSPGSEALVPGDVSSADEFSLKCSGERSEEGDHCKMGDLVASGGDDITVQSETVAELLDISSDPPEKMNIGKDIASVHEQENPTNVAVEVDSALGAE